ncbi:MAG: SMC family ATPase [Chloroflexia bacterium]|nr:SMC family ATPase [Chloroflexia bacterium]
MIITKLTLENYKQYRGEQSFPIAEDAIVGVVGANGVGKTTIFEAIEWCLYKPSSIRNTDIRPRTVGGEVRVVVQMTTQSGHEVYEVERILKRGATQATVYRLTDSGGSEPIVQGTREVTDFITTRLIGLSHSAFVATFFTRQKELSFFGGLGATDRRREVGKLLGFETIKQAQTIIGEERGRARSDADALQRRYDAQTSGRYLDAEIEEISGTISERIEAVGIARNSLTSAEQQLAATEQANQLLQEQRDQDAAIAADLRDQQSQRTAATERRDGINADLERLDHQQEERASLATQAAKREELAARRASLETERERFERRHQARKDEKRGEQELADRVQDLRTIVDRTAKGTYSPDWSWSDADSGSPIEAIDRLVTVASSVDVTGIEQRCGSLKQAVIASETLERERKTLATYLEKRQKLQDQATQLLADGDPSQFQQGATARLNESQARLSDKRAEADALASQQDRSRHLIERLRQQQFDDVCPTCGRAFDDDEAQLVIATMSSAISARDEAIVAIHQEAEHLANEVKAAQHEIDALRTREKAILETKTRIANSAEHIERQEAEAQRWQTTLSEALQALSLSAAPTSDQIKAADQELAHKRDLHGATQPLQMIQRNVRDAVQRRQQAEKDLASLTDIAWDPDLYRAVTTDHEQASRAASAIEQIDRQLARRPQLDHDLKSTSEAMKACDEAVNGLEAKRKELGFDPLSLQTSNEALRTARQQDRNARDHLHAAERTKREAEFRLETLKKEQQQLADLAREADERRRVHEDLNVMYSEFSEFDKFVAQHLSPMLSDITSDIVTEMTDGKYDRVTFDEDYGIKVFDQSDEGFPLDTFSGGERDAVSLAARLALSRIIGQQAANPPGFLVLDEVFGSLDADRRERVLTLLGQHSNEYFRQMFVISHVDDVQQSPVFDTIWQVEQRDDGSSQFVTNEGALSEALEDK